MLVNRLLNDNNIYIQLPHKISHARYKVLAVVLMKTKLFWDMTTYQSLKS